jgi:hypothetical protein
MTKRVIKKIIRENSFEGAPGGGSGTLNYGQSFGTPGGGNITQNSSKFSSSDKTSDHFQPNTASGSAATPEMKDRPDRTGNNQGMDGTDSRKKTIKTGYPDGKIINTSDDGTTDNDGDGVTGQKVGNKITSPAGAADNAQSEKPLNPDQQFDPQVDQLFKGKKQTPSPDEIMSALQYELNNMTKKDKTIAKQQVLKNMKKDPHYYSRLNMLNIDDKKMKVDESTFSKTKAVLDEMIAAKKKSVAIADTPELRKIFQDLYDKRNAVKKDNQS